MVAPAPHTLHEGENVQPITTLNAEQEHQRFLAERAAERREYERAARLAALASQDQVVHIACSLYPSADSLIDFRLQPIGENSIPFAKYHRELVEWRRRNETTRLDPKKKPIEWTWAQGKPALGFRPECVPVDVEYLPDEEQLEYYTRTGINELTTFVPNETMDSRAGDPVPDYIRAREIGINLTSTELAFAYDDDEDANAEPGGTESDEEGYCRQTPVAASDDWRYQPMTPYMRAWIEWERRRFLSSNPIRVYPIPKNGELSFQVEGLPKTDGNTAANMRAFWVQRAVEQVVASGYRGTLSWEDYQNWLEYNRDERQHIGMTPMQEHLYLHAPDIEAEVQRAEWVDRLYQGVYESLEELTDEQMRDNEVPARLLHLRSHPNSAAALQSLQAEHQNSPTMLGMDPNINWLRDDEPDDLTYSERVSNWFEGVELALLEGMRLKREREAKSMVSGS